MALQAERQTFEAERLIGGRSVQVLARAEALVPGAGRDAIEALLADAVLYISEADVQADRVVIEGSISCQAIYRQGEACDLRALTAQTTLNHVLEMPGAQPGMLCRARGAVDHVEARYENGHMVFLITCDLSAQVCAIAPAQVIGDVTGVDGLQTVYRTIRSVKLAAEATELSLLKDEVALPAGMDARAALMDRMAVEVDEVRPDLGGVRVKGRAWVETLVSSGVDGRPAVSVRYPMELDQLVEMPAWLTGNVFAEADVRSVRSRVEATEEEGEMRLACEAEVRVRVMADMQDSAQALTDAYVTRGSTLEIERTNLEVCEEAKRARINEVVRGTVLIGENAPGVGTVVAVQVFPSIGELRSENGRGVIDGVAETRVLYVPGGSDLPASAEAELPFSLTVPVELDEQSMVSIQVIAAEANALMSDRLEMKLQLSVTCETRRRDAVEIVSDIREGAPIQRRPGIVVCWPGEGETPWQVGKTYGVPVESVGEVKAGEPVVLRI